MSKNNVPKNGNNYVKCIDEYIPIVRKVWSVYSVCARHIVWWYRSGGSIRGGLGRLEVSQKRKIAKIWTNFETTVLVNYSPKFILLFEILNLSKPASILLYPHNCYIIIILFHETLIFSIRKLIFKRFYIFEYWEL